MAGVLEATVVAPKPRVCEWCAGAGLEPYEEGIACLACDGAGYAPCVFDLAATRSHKQRSVRFDPNAMLLTVTQSRKVKRYELREFTPGTGWDGRAWMVVKQESESGECYEVFVGGRGEMSCSCAGQTYLAAAKANQRAFECGEAIVPTAGCVHLDSLLPLLRAGWFDLEGSTTDSTA